MNDFLIRQLYYPFRLWSEKLPNKKVVPILMIYSFDIFKFYIYEFSDIKDYSSMRLVETKSYAIAPEEINQIDVSNIFTNTPVVPEDTEIPFPQANNFVRLVDLMSLLFDRDLTQDDVTENYQFNIRQTSYYVNAGRYLGLIEKYKNPLTGYLTFALTEEGKNILTKRPKLKYLELIKKILEHQVFKEAFRLTIKNGEIPDKQMIYTILIKHNDNLNKKTLERRASTVRSWIKWIWEQIQD
ncbi:MAG: hypothetical protein LRZ84_19035 [Desertifilum sp.]|nr:hypothetical protein [Desertifilum sp.]